MVQTKVTENELKTHSDYPEKISLHDDDAFVIDDSQAEGKRKSLTNLDLKNVVLSSVPEQYPAGVVQMFSGEVPPSGWHLCDGAAVSKSVYADLYSIIGTKYGSGSNGNVYFIDSSSGSNSPHQIFTSGDTNHSSGAAKFGTSAIQFDGSADYLKVGNSPDWDFGTGDFTIDTWVYPTAIDTKGEGIIGRLGASNIDGWGLAIRGSTYGTVGTVGLYNYVGGWVIVTTEIVNLNSWNHIALVKFSGNIKIYVNGVQSGEVYAGSLHDNDRNISLGNMYSPPDLVNSGWFLSGYLDEFRISKGIARWTSNFTPPTAPYSSGSGNDSNTVLLVQSDYVAGDAFNLPNFNGRTPVGYKSGVSPFDERGNMGGEKTNTLSVSMIPSHFHRIDIYANYSNNVSQNHTHYQIVSAWQVSGGVAHRRDYNDSLGNYGAYTQGTNTGNQTSNHKHYFNIAQYNSYSTGLTEAHNNMASYLVTNFIIKV